MAETNPVLAVMCNHRSVRKFEERPVPVDLLERLVACGQAASSSSFIQAYAIVRVTDPGHRNAIAEAAGGQAWVSKAPEFLVFCADLQRVNHCCVKAGLGELEGHTEHFIAATVDAALLGQNILLAAESEGLGGVFIGGIRNDPERVCELLALPHLVYPVFGMCLGWPAQAPQGKPRLPVEAVLHDGGYRLDRVADDVEAYDRLMAAYYGSRAENARQSDWSTQTAQAVQGKKREHMLGFLRRRGLLLR